MSENLCIFFYQYCSAQRGDIYIQGNIFHLYLECILFKVSQHKLLTRLFSVWIYYFTFFLKWKLPISVFFPFGKVGDIFQMCLKYFNILLYFIVLCNPTRLCHFNLVPRLSQDFLVLVRLSFLKSNLMSCFSCRSKTNRLFLVVHLHFPIFWPEISKLLSKFSEVFKSICIMNTHEL